MGDFSGGMVAEGAASPRPETLAPPLRKKLTICRGIFTDDNTLLILPREIIDSSLRVNS